MENKLVIRAYFFFVQKTDGVVREIKKQSLERICF